MPSTISLPLKSDKDFGASELTMLESPNVNLVSFSEKSIVA